MHDILRLQRLVQQLASKVRIFMGCQEANSTNSKLLYESHHEIMALAEATFKEMSLQVSTACLENFQSRWRYQHSHGILGLTVVYDIAAALPLSVQPNPARHAYFGCMT